MSNIILTPNTLYQSDCLLFLERVPSSSVTLAYLDPPWNTGTDSPFSEEKTNSNRTYMQFISHVCQQIHRILDDKGAIYLHTNTFLGATFRLILEQIFERRFLNEIILPIRVRRQYRNNTPIINHNTILVYSKSDEFVYNPQFAPASNLVQESYTNEDENGKYRLTKLTTRSGSHSNQFVWRNYSLPPNQNWKFSSKSLEILAEQKKIYFGNENSLPKFKQYMEDHLMQAVGSVWDDINYLHGSDAYLPNDIRYTSQQPIELLERIINMGSNPMDFVLDPFCGSGTTIVASQLSDRRWIGCDLSPSAIGITSKRLVQLGMKAHNDFSTIYQPEILDIEPVWRNYNDLTTKWSSPKIKIVYETEIDLEESMYIELKEVKGKNPVNSIKNTADEYVVAFLNSGIRGSLYWGVTDSNRKVVGVKLKYKEKDSLKQIVINKLGEIEPGLRQDAYWIEFHPVYIAYDESRTITDLYVIQLNVFPPTQSVHPYYTGGGDLFLKTETGKKRLKGHSLTKWIQDNL